MIESIVLTHTNTQKIRFRVGFILFFNKNKKNKKA
jgi:hypothetical protein